MNDLLKNSDFLGFIAALFSLLVTIYIFRITPKYQLVRERYDKLIYPVFDKIEPYLFKKIPIGELNSILSIIDEHMDLSGGKLKEIVFYCKKDPGQENFNSLCRCINNEYDRACSRLGLKKRNIIYRLNRRQYQTKLMFWIYVIGQVFLLLICFFIFLLIFGLLTNLIEKL